MANQGSIGIFLALYREELEARYEWTKDSAKLGRFLDVARKSLLDRQFGWNHDGDAVTAAWKRMGNKGKPSLKQLRELPRN